MSGHPILVLDNGASAIKAGLVSSGGLVQPRLVSNAIVRSKGDKKTFIGHELDQCSDFSSLHYRLPFERGYLTDWDAQKAVWDGLFSGDALKLQTSGASLLITEPYFNLPNIQDVYNQFVFEEYEFRSYVRCTPAALVPHGNIFNRPDLPSPECVLIIDSGFSFTHVVPIMNDSLIWAGVRRLDVGGKLLTNHLKELVSFRQWNMMDETYIVNDIKEKCCYVSQNFSADMESCRLDAKRNPIVMEYVLPDFSANRHGRVKQADDILADSDQVLAMNSERFAVPEVIFRPSDIGLDQTGLARTVANSIASLPEDLQGLFWANIGLVGGNVKFPGFRARLERELRSLAPVDCVVNIYESSDPILDAFRGGVQFVQNGLFSTHAVTRAEYLEGGSNACRRKFKDWKDLPRNDGAEVPKEDSAKDRVRGRSRARTKESEPIRKPNRSMRGKPATGRGGAR